MSETRKLLDPTAGQEPIAFERTHRARERDGHKTSLPHHLDERPVRPRRLDSADDRCSLVAGRRQLANRVSRSFRWYAEKKSSGCLRIEEKLCARLSKIAPK